ncbi:MAG: DUF4864 domain-containing protein [Rhodobiaceae bacterium]|nr:DUF4864 domain-containing protein [Rhodobiaceae bacterium]
MTRTGKTLVRLLAVLALVPLMWLPARADDTGAFRDIISQQVDAFSRDDGVRAFSFASPGIREKFQTPDRFMDMVRSGYSPVYRPRSFSFGAVTHELAGLPTQRVVFVDQTGQIWTALYAFEQQPDGSWKIAAVTFVRTDDAVS